LPPPQIAIFVLPLVVLVGWIIHKPFMLDLDPFAIVVLTLSVIHAYFVSSDGNSNWRATASTRCCNRLCCTRSCSPAARLRILTEPSHAAPSAPTA